MARFTRWILGTAACVVLPACVLLLNGGPPGVTGPATEKRFPPLQVPADFKATLFACDPLIEYPSVIAVGPRPGAVFVAVDYMTGLGTDGKVKSEIRLVEDTNGDGYADKATVFAKGFNSIQGIAYHDNVVYVMHAPFLTSLRDTKKTGSADERRDLLTGLGLTPEQNPVRLHCANGVTIGHDGWLYLAMGDNGIDVRRPEGDRLIHHGGCMLRCRPDGRDLHVFSTGLRNIYDIALDAELNVFTRDNENDGGTYMIRVCHSFHGADHGYPYDYYERPDHAMRPIGDFGRGSAAGGLCYLETQFPPEYRGNLFFCEWGKSIVRYDLKRKGAGFSPVKEIEFARGDDKDSYPFKPTDIVVQRDGTLMIADYADGQRPKRGRGRIYHVAHVGKSSDAKRPNLGLDSESHAERWAAQASIEREGGAAIRRRLKAAPLPRARMHLIWALARVEGARASDDLLASARTDADANVRAQAIRAVADLADPVLVQHKLDAGRGDDRLARALADGFTSQNGAGRLETVIALGRLRWQDAPAWAARQLRPDDDALKHATMHLLRRCGDWPSVLKLLDLPDAHPLRSVVMHALADRFEPVVVNGLIDRLGSDKQAAHRRDYADLLARVHRKPAAWKYWGYRPGPRPANTEAWDQSGAIVSALDRLLADPDREVRLAALTRMRRESVPIALASLERWLSDERRPEQTRAILAALADRPAEEVRSLLDAVVRDGEHESGNRLSALEQLARGDAAPKFLVSYARELAEDPVLAEVLRRLTGHPRHANPMMFLSRLKSGNAEVRAAAVFAIGELKFDAGAERIVLLLGDPDVRVRRSAAGAAGKLAATAAVEPLLKLLRDPDPQVRAACLDSLRQLREPRAIPAALAALRDRATDLPALAYLGALGNPDHVSAVAELAKHNPSSETPAAIVRVLTAWADRPTTTPAQSQAIERAIADVHGTTGILPRWRVSESLRADALQKTIDQTFQAATLPTDWKVHRALGAESRITLTKQPDGAWLAATDVNASEAAAVEFLASSHGSLRVWLNGKAIYQREQPRKLQLDSDRFDGRLSQGRNRLVVQIGPSSTAAEFHLRFRRKSSRAEHEKLTLAALARPGNSERGRSVFLKKEKSQCVACHPIAGKGERIGPDLTGVGARFSRIHLIESILEPSRAIAPSYGTFTAALKNGKTIVGVKYAEDARTLTLADNQGKKHMIARGDLDELVASPVSTMPEGLEKRLTQDEFVDLIAFLMSEKSATAK